MSSVLDWNRRVLRNALLVAAVLPLGYAAGAEPPETDPAFELIVLLAPPAHGAPTAEELVDAVRRQGPPSLLPGLVPPVAAQKMVEAAHPGVLDPDSPRGRLERYVVLAYPAGTDLAAVLASLERDPFVEWAGPNRVAKVSLTPTDPLYSVSGVVNQHGHDMLGLLDAWDWVGGHAYVGVVDTGIDPAHPDLRGQHVVSGGFHNWDGGALRPHLSWNFAASGSAVSNPDEYQQSLDQFGTFDYPDRAGHGTMVAGTIAASTNNSIGVAGACLHCSLMALRVSTNLWDGGITFNNRISEADAAEGVTGGVDRGAQVLNLSFGFTSHANCATSPSQPLCVAIDYAVDRDVVVVAASGNDGTNGADFPARNGWVFAAGGVLPNNDVWSGSNLYWDQFFAPATNWSTFYAGMSYAPNVACDDSAAVPSGDGYGACTGTSVSAPFLSASLAILRSANPLLSAAQLRDLLEDNLRPPNNWNWNDGLGVPEIDEAVFDALGRAGGVVVPNRLTPLFSLFSSLRNDWFYTTVPQWGARVRGSYGFYTSSGTDVPGYTDFPDAPCASPPCAPASASIYVFTGRRAPYSGAPVLTPLYRSTYLPASSDRDTAFAIDSTGILALAAYGYQVDGIEGYLYAPCSPEPSCIPTGASKVLQRYNATLNDHAVFPENELATWQANGYTQVRGTATLGYAYRNLDADGDDLVDGFESLIGTDPADADSDCDGDEDGAEILVYDTTTGYGDPLDGPCA